MSIWRRRTLTLAPRPRGVHLVTREVLAGGPEISDLEVGLLHVFLRHTSASLAINENASPDVRSDLERWLSDIVPDAWPGFAHTLEGADDMPAHTKAVVVGTDLTIPIDHGRLALGTWQGVYLLEHRDDGGARSVVVTATGSAGAGAA